MGAAIAVANRASVSQFMERGSVIGLQIGPITDRRGWPDWQPDALVLLDKVSHKYVLVSPSHRPLTVLHRDMPATPHRERTLGIEKSHWNMNLDFSSYAIPLGEVNTEISAATMTPAMPLSR